jgi:hypothetical protein
MAGESMFAGAVLADFVGRPYHIVHTYKELTSHQSGSNQPTEKASPPSSVGVLLRFFSGRSVIPRTLVPANRSILGHVHYQLYA